jgi:CRISPR/Cas system-associated protein Cas10 (large subunit of type III CRISPR-Cas system)
MLNPASKLGKSTYKCAHCHDLSIILDSTDLSEPICPICKGLLQIDSENTEIAQSFTNQLLSLT